VLDARSEIGGWARTTTVGRFRFNFGPHALYRAGQGAAALRDLGAWPSGRLPSVIRSRASMDGSLTRMPGRAAVAALMRVMRSAGRDSRDAGLVSISAEEWLRDRARTEDGFRLAAAFTSLTTYAANIDRMSAESVARQIHTGLRGVQYVDDGWAQIVRRLEAVATDNGATIIPSAKSTQVVADGDLVTVTTDRGDLRGAAVVLAAGGPGMAADLLGGASPSLATAAADADPIHAATLELGLPPVPRRHKGGILGVDRPSYAFFHTPAAALVDGDGDVAHVMAYEPDPSLDPDGTDALLDSIAEEFQPGWASHVEEQRRGRRLPVASDRPHVGRGLAGRPPVAVPEVGGVFVAGDWVGPDELLAGAALASGKAAGLAAAAHRPTQQRTSSASTAGHER
jgi:phytoene dehydrogenase-like protein